MEGTSLKSRKNEARRLLRGCFKNPMFSFVPFEIWRDIVSFADAKTLVTASKTCWGFKELVDDVGERNLNLALLLRKEDQIPLALKYLLKCAENGNVRAMFHLGYAYDGGGWGLHSESKKAAEWFRKSAEAGYGPGMAFHAHSFFCRVKEINEREEQESWAQKALSSNNHFAVGCCTYWGVGTPEDKCKALMHFQASADEGCEYGQNWLGQFYQCVDEIEIDFEKARYWYEKSAGQGNCDSYYHLGCLRRHGEGCDVDEEKAMLLFKKAAKQGNKNALAESITKYLIK